MKFRIRKTIEPSFLYSGREICYWVEPLNPILRWMGYSAFSILFDDKVVTMTHSRKAAIEYIKKIKSGYFKTKTLNIEEVEL